MNLTDELRKLSDLHEEGHLTDKEFSDAKQKLISDSQTESEDPSEDEKSVSGKAVRITEKTYHSSRWSSGNFFFPDTLTLANDGMLFRKGAMFGSREEHINYRSIASFRVTNGVFLSDICIETSGGSQPIFINGLWKSEAREIQNTIRAFQGASGKKRS